MAKGQVGMGQDEYRENIAARFDERSGDVINCG